MPLVIEDTPLILRTPPSIDTMGVAAPRQVASSRDIRTTQDPPPVTRAEQRSTQGVAPLGVSPLSLSTTEDDDAFASINWFRGANSFVKTNETQCDDVVLYHAQQPLHASQASCF